MNGVAVLHAERFAKEHISDDLDHVDMARQVGDEHGAGHALAVTTSDAAKERGGASKGDAVAQEATHAMGEDSLHVHVSGLFPEVVRCIEGVEAGTLAQGHVADKVVPVNLHVERSWPRRASKKFTKLVLVVRLGHELLSAPEAARHRSVHVHGAAARRRLLKACPASAGWSGRLKNRSEKQRAESTMPGDLSWMQTRHDELAEGSLLWEPPTLEGPNTPRCTMEGRETIMLSANNYLNLTTHPKVVEASIAATRAYGAGSGSVRAIAGTMDLHLEAERAVADFKGAEAALIYSAGYTANVGLIPTLVQGPQDVIISDALNHGSIIDGVRLTKASRAVYGHNDMGELEAVLKQHEDADRKLIITDGVFSMDGDIAPLDDIVHLAEEHHAMILVDDCHGEGVLGEGGRGIVDHFNVHGKVEFEIGSFSKALGVQGGIMAGSELSRSHALNHSRSWLLSGSQPPGVAAAQKAAIDVLVDEPEHHRRLWDNTAYFRGELQSMGFDTGLSETPIIPIMCGPSSTAKALSSALGEEGVMAGAIVFPMVARDAARVRTQMSAGLSREDLDEVLRILERLGPKLGLI